MRKFSQKKGQTIIELAIFGSIILFLFGALLSYMQRLNDQQYVQMETFRRALEKACTYQGESSEGAGGSVQYTLMQNRRHVDLTSGFRKGSPSSTGYSANIFWAIPKAGAQAESLIAYKVNDDEKIWKYRDLIPQDLDDSESFRIEDTTVDSQTNFEETVTKEEDLKRIINTKEAALSDNIRTTINYTIRAKDKDNNPDNDPILEGPEELWSVDQGLYRGNDGQYKYSEAARDTEVSARRTWTTEFKE